MVDNKELLRGGTAVFVLLALFNVNKYSSDFDPNAFAPYYFVLLMLLVSNLLVLNDVAKKWYLLSMDFLTSILLFNLLLRLDETLTVKSRSSSVALAYLFLLAITGVQASVLLIEDRLIDRVANDK